MADVPAIKSCSAKLKFKTADGATRESAFDSKNTGVNPNTCWTSIAREVARVAEVAGFGAEVEQAVVEARQAVQKWRETQESISI